MFGEEIVNEREEWGILLIDGSVVKLDFPFKLSVIGGDTDSTLLLWGESFNNEFFCLFDKMIMTSRIYTSH